MEILFETKTSNYLKEVIYRAISQEETLETIIPDSYPDADQILDAFGAVVIRGKEFHNGSMTLSGGVHAGVLYAPTDLSEPRSLHAYIPFTVKLDGEGITQDAQAYVVCHVSGIDARILNSRKILLRAELGGNVTGYLPAGLDTYVCGEREDPDLQVRRNTYQVIQAMEMAEKPFKIAEEAELPAGSATMGALCRYQIDTELTEARILGNKGIFKGDLLLKLLYFTESEELTGWSCRMPFSQYVDLTREYNEDAELKLNLIPTDIAVEDVGGQGKRLVVNLQMLAQCVVVDRSVVEVVEDAYSLSHDFTSQAKTVDLSGRLDRQVMSVTLRAPVQAAARSVLDTRLYPGVPSAQREGETVRIDLPILANVLYLDENGMVQGVSQRLEAACQTELAEGCECRPTARLLSEPFAVPSGEGIEVRGAVEFTVDSMTSRGIEVLSGGELSEEPAADADRPSVILRTVDADEDLWMLAKQCHTTIEAIRSANAMEDDRRPAQGMLLIPVMK